MRLPCKRGQSLASRQALSAFFVGQLNACARLDARSSLPVFDSLRDRRKISLMFAYALDEKYAYVKSTKSPAFLTSCLTVSISALSAMRQPLCGHRSQVLSALFHTTHEDIQQPEDWIIEKDTASSISAIASMQALLH
jgi:hypothetical protein